MQIEGSVALVTGSAKRVGRAIASALARKGGHIAVHYNRSASEAKAFAKELRGKYRVEAEVFQADLSRAKEAAALGEAVFRRFRRVDVLVNSASTYEKTPFGSVTERDWDFHLDANLKGPFFLSQAVGRHMKKAGRGKVINICDWAALRPYAGYAPYCASKAGLLCLTYSLAKALAPEAQVNAILPGPVLLPPGTGRREAEAVRRATLTQTLGSPADVAAAVAFLIEGSDFITGAALTVDGGRLIA